MISGRVYVSASEEIRERLKDAWQGQKRIIYTDDYQEAEYILLEKQPDGRYLDEQVRMLILARENSMPVRSFQMASPEMENLMRQTRQKFDMGMEID